MGSLTIPGRVARTAQEHSIHIDLLSPRAKLIEAIELAVPGIERQHVHVWTLGGKSRETRLGRLWAEWRSLGVHLVEEGWTLPSGLPAFTESGTYAPTYLVGTWKDAAGAPHVFLCDGYAASAEALQAATLSDALDLDVTMALLSERFELPLDAEARLCRLDPGASDFAEGIARLFGGTAADNAERVERYRSSLQQMALANVPVGTRVVRANDFFPEKSWRVLAATGYMGTDPYTGLPGVSRVAEDAWQVTAQLATREATLRVRFTFRFLESERQTRLVFSPLLERFLAGEDYRQRAVKISDSGRIRNELQTLASQALEFGAGDSIRVHFDRIDDMVIPAAKKKAVREVLEWYKANHPVWFSWLEIA
jgi:hypothetical protein